MLFSGFVIAFGTRVGSISQSGKTILKTTTRCFSGGIKFNYDVTKLYDTNYLNIPKLPIPDVKDTVEAHLLSIRPLVSDEKFEKQKQLAKEFVEKDAPALQAELKELSPPSGYPYSYIEKFWDEMYRGGRWPLMIHTNPFYILNDESDPVEQEQTRRAAKFVNSSVRWWQKVTSGNLEADAQKDGSPLCMYQFGNVFGFGREPKTDIDAITYHPFTKHVVVICQNQYFKVPVIDDSGNAVLSVEALQKRLDEIKNVSQSNPIATRTNDVGLFTAGGRTEYAEARSEIISYDPKNAESYKAMDECLFVLILEDQDSSSILERSKTFLTGPDGSNRWFDKHQVIVNADGGLGINFEHSIQDGMTWNRWLQEVWHDMRGASSGFSPLPNSQADFGAIEPITWNLSETGLSNLETAARFAQDEINNLDMHVLEFKDFGRNLVKTWKMSPDAASQMAMQLAYYKLHGEPGATYEACAMKNFWHGRTETIRSCTIEAADMCKSFLNNDSDEIKKQKLLAAAATHIEVAKGAQTQSGKYRGVDRHLTALKNIAEMNGKDLGFFKSEGYTKSNTFVMSTSNVTTPFFDLFGFGAVVPHGYGFGYQTLPESLPFCITSFKSCPETGSKKMADAVEESLHEFKKLF
mmetsp:Transcript_1714/g.2580  ORF Transcript_1714/g.2580 Transcript_1714/m.2580 type:complete len:636 (+) Transcript_1714:136-2043(+)|eukprot:CAMPEP_0204835648 /NCGR_PEP_ID=MMETSP1346-20131115/23202_1 /ASSEMBLY_ACC=CAM_ASM_000771 /TAXON_ID=215587 /ORGANISM="Aplanochytrium stocchinoi, Strain GSBS06" /LENGTH=635 /DNA_ID=CAMNT_0051969839 /DNA_START=12 /DNA_END=1919 /DNA_ORIENTATION=-